MDLRFSSDAPTEAEREAVDRVLGAAMPLDPAAAGRARRPRAPRPAAARRSTRCRTASDGSAAVGSTTSAAGSPSHRLRPTASRRSTTSSRSSLVLRAWCMRASTSRARSPAGPWRVRRARASGCASALRRRSSSRPVRRRSLLQSTTASGTRRGRFPSGDSRGSCCSPGPASSTRRRSPRTKSHGGYDALRKAIEIGAVRRRRRSHAERPRRSWRRRVPDRPQVAGGRGARVDAALPRGQRRRERAGHVQGSGGDRERSVLARRGDDDRRLRDRVRAGLPLPPRRVPDRLAADRGMRSTPREPPATWATTSSGAAFASTSRCARARARTSAARRPRCSTRSRATAASRVASRRSLSMSASSASRRS